MLKVLVESLAKELAEIALERAKRELAYWELKINPPKPRQYNPEGEAKVYDLKTGRRIA